MVKGLRLVTGIVLVVMTAGAASAQRPRTVPQDKTEVTTNVPPPPPAPQTFNAKYEGGVFGYNKKMEGTLTFVGGTGRFADASGSAALAYLTDPFTGQGVFSIDGTIDY